MYGRAVATQTFAPYPHQAGLRWIATTTFPKRLWDFPQALRGRHVKRFVPKTRCTLAKLCRGAHHLRYPVPTVSHRALEVAPITMYIWSGLALSGSTPMVHAVPTKASAMALSEYHPFLRMCLWRDSRKSVDTRLQAHANIAGVNTSAPTQLLRVCRPQRANPCA